MKTFNNFVSTITLVSAMAVALVAFNTAIAADTATDNSTSQTMTSDAPAQDNSAPSIEPMTNDQSATPATDASTTDATSTDTSTTKPMQNTSDESDANKDQPWYKKWLAKLGM